MSTFFSTRDLSAIRVGFAAPSPRQETPMSAATRPADASKSATELIESPDFRALVRTRWSVSFTLLALLFVGYYGYILLVATAPAAVSYTHLTLPTIYSV